MAPLNPSRQYIGIFIYTQETATANLQNPHKSTQVSVQRLNMYYEDFAGHSERLLLHTSLPFQKCPLPLLVNREEKT
jgi:hypothetical protein